MLQHVPLAKSSDDANTYLVNDTADPLQRSLTSLELTDVLMGAPPPGASTTWPPPTGDCNPLLSSLFVFFEMPLSHTFKHCML